MYMHTYIQTYIYTYTHKTGLEPTNNLVCKQTLYHLVAKLAKLLSCVITFLYHAFDCMFSSCHVYISCSHLNFRFHVCFGVP